MIVKLKVTKTHENARMPSKAYHDDACFDLFVPEYVSVNKFETKVIPVGLRISIPPGFEIDIREKSGLAAKGIRIGGGVVDNGYDGEIGVVVTYFGPEDNFVFGAGNKIAQFKVVERINTEIIEFSRDEFDLWIDQHCGEYHRGGGGFGSSGR